MLGKATKVRLLDVQHAKNMENIITYKIFKAKRFEITYMDDHRVVTNIDSEMVFYVGKKENILIVRNHGL